MPYSLYAYIIRASRRVSVILFFTVFYLFCFSFSLVLRVTFPRCLEVGIINEIFLVGVDTTAVKIVAVMTTNLWY